ncbi:MAG TPA: hypothetical protein DCE18_19800, partial [Syntrophobacteraceae bacterium]|nr:hypothetical protein [Syntrophobacteraceae bacterium]
FIELAGEINISMPQYVLQQLMGALNDRRQCLNGSKILVLGVAYKKDIDDDRESPSYEIMHLLMERGAEVRYNDPHIPKLRPGRKQSFALESVPLSAELLASVAAVLILTDHSDYDYEWIVKHAALVVDTRNATKQVPNGRKKIVKA